MFQAERKVPGGKLVRVKFEVDEGTIRSARIEGDFFVHPEEGIAALESSLEGKRTNDIEGMRSALARALGDKGIELVGFSVDDIVSLIGGK
jgi:lipoate-protein ligase A